VTIGVFPVAFVFYVCIFVVKNLDILIGNFATRLSLSNYSLRNCQPVLKLWVRAKTIILCSNYW